MPRGTPTYVRINSRVYLRDYESGEVYVHGGNGLLMTSVVPSRSGKSWTVRLGETGPVLGRYMTRGKAKLAAVREALQRQQIDSYLQEFMHEQGE